MFVWEASERLQKTPARWIVLQNQKDTRKGAKIEIVGDTSVFRIAKLWMILFTSLLALLLMMSPTSDDKANMPQLILWPCSPRNCPHDASRQFWEIQSFFLPLSIVVWVSIGDLLVFVNKPIAYSVYRCFGRCSKKPPFSIANQDCLWRFIPR